MSGRNRAPHAGRKGTTRRAFLKSGAMGSVALLALRFEDGLSIEEIAAMLEVPAGTIKSRLHHAKQRLRALMEE